MKETISEITDAISASCYECRGAEAPYHNGAGEEIQECPVCFGTNSVIMTPLYPMDTMNGTRYLSAAQMRATQESGVLVVVIPAQTGAIWIKS